MLAKVSYTAPIWAAAAITLVATAMAWLWLPETVHRARAGTGNPFRYLPPLVPAFARPRRAGIDFLYWFGFAVFQATFALFAARRFNFDAPQTGYFFAAFGVLGAIVQGAFIRPIVHRLGDKPTFLAGLTFGAIGFVAAAFAQSVTMFALSLVPLALGIGFGTRRCRVWSAASRAATSRARAGRGERRRKPRPHGRAVWGNASLQHYGESTPYLSAAALLVLTLLLTLGGFQVGEQEAIASELLQSR